MHRPTPRVKVSTTVVATAAMASTLFAGSRVVATPSRTGGRDNRARSRASLRGPTACSAAATCPSLSPSPSPSSRLHALPSYSPSAPLASKTSRTRARPSTACSPPSANSGDATRERGPGANATGCNDCSDRSPTRPGHSRSNSTRVNAPTSDASSNSSMPALDQRRIVGETMPAGYESVTRSASRPPSVVSPQWRGYT